MTRKTRVPPLPMRSVNPQPAQPPLDLSLPLERDLAAEVSSLMVMMTTSSSKWAADLETVRSTSEKEVAELKVTVTELTTKNNLLEAKVQKISDKNSELDATVTKLTTKNNLLETKNERLEARVQQISDKNIELEATVTKLTTKNNLLETKNERLEARVQQISDKNIELEATVTKLTTKNNLLETKNERLEARVQQINNKNIELETIVQRISDKNIKLEAAVQQISGRNTELEAEVQRISDRNIELESSIQRINNSNIELKATVQRLGIKLSKEIQGKNAAGSKSHSSRISKLENDRLNLNSQIKNLKDSIGNLKNSVSYLEDAKTKHIQTLRIKDARFANVINELQKEGKAAVAAVDLKFSALIGLLGFPADALNSSSIIFREASLRIRSLVDSWWRASEESNRLKLMLETFNTSFFETVSLLLNGFPFGNSLNAGEVEVVLKSLERQWIIVYGIWGP